MAIHVMTGEDGNARTVLVCDVCEQLIANPGDASVVWSPSDPDALKSIFFVYSDRCGDGLGKSLGLPGARRMFWRPVDLFSEYLTSSYGAPVTLMGTVADHEPDPEPAAEPEPRPKRHLRLVRSDPDERGDEAAGERPSSP